KGSTQAEEEGRQCFVLIGISHTRFVIRAFGIGSKKMAAGAQAPGAGQSAVTEDGDT
ncbi:hypothetical protein P7K49_036684, partial [Saguinus oedipus]